MVKYRNPRNDELLAEQEAADAEQALMNEPAKNVEDEGFKKRYGDLRRFQAQKELEAKGRIDELERKLDQALRGQIKPPKSAEDVEAWSKNYPEFAGILETIVSSRIKEATTSTNEKLGKLEQDRQEFEAEKAVTELRRRHPDFDKLAKSDNFHQWLEEQDQVARDAIYNGFNVKAADLVIKAYKADSKIPTSNIEVEDGFSGRQAAQAVQTRTRTEAPDFDGGDYEFTESQIERESKKNRKWFDANEAKILSASQRGKILYDLSGGAR